MSGDVRSAPEIGEHDADEVRPASSSSKIVGNWASDPVASPGGAEPGPLIARGILEYAGHVAGAERERVVGR